MTRSAGKLGRVVLGLGVAAALGFGSTSAFAGTESGTARKDRFCRDSTCAFTCPSTVGYCDYSVNPYGDCVCVGG